MDDVRAALFGLDGFEVLDAVETADGLLEVTVEMIDPVLGCPECGTPAGRSRGRPVVCLRDVCSAGRHVRVSWRKHRNECPDPDCDRRSYTKDYALELFGGTGWEVISISPPGPYIQHHIVCRPV